MSDYSSDTNGGPFDRWGLMVLAIIFPWLVGGFVDAHGLRSTLLGFVVSATIAIAVMVLTFRVLPAIRARSEAATQEQSSTSQDAEGAKAIKLVIGCVYVLVLMVMLPAFGALDVHDHEVLAGVVYAIYLATTTAVWILVDTQIIDRRIAARHAKFRAPRTAHTAMLPSPSMDGDYSKPDDDRSEEIENE